jgi:lipoprotein-anchoring transpeptidase ErfK/SrfK
VRARLFFGFGLFLFATALGCGHEGGPSEQATAATATVQSATVSAPATPRAKGPEGAAPPGDLPDLPKSDGTYVVGLDGSSRAWPPPLPEGVPRVAALAIETPVLAEPDVFAPRLGLLRTGAIVEIDPKPVQGKGCAAGFRAIKPLGYVCLGSATLDLSNPIVRASSRRPDVTQKLPYMYGMAVRGGPAFSAIPSANDLKELEPHLASHLKMWRKDTVNGAPYGIELWGKWKKDPPPPALLALEERRTDPDIPWFVTEGRVPNLSNLVSLDSVKAGEFQRHNGIAFIDSFLADGRRYNVAVDLRLMPADRFRPIKGSDFHGFRIPEDVKLPFAIVKSKKAKKLVEGPGGRLVPDGDVEWRTTVNTTGRQRIQRGKTYDELEGGSWIADDEVARVRIAEKMPGWANDGEKWIDINVTRQILVAYEGTKPVYATLVSTGEAGLDDPKTTKSTARGIFRIHTKHITATMDSKVVGEEFELRDVPYVQYFHEGYALHAAYWHDVFGQPKSHGCINLAPEDARRLFFWTEPQVPPGWHAASKAKTGTVVFIHP